MNYKEEMDALGLPFVRYGLFLIRDCRGNVIKAYQDDYMIKAANEHHALKAEVTKAKTEIKRLMEENEELKQKLKHKGIACDKHDLVGGWACPRCLTLAEAEVEELKEKYFELIMMVASKFPDESRHQTALRYIEERENASAEPCKEALKETP